jgi:Tfp pilus assembly major pilin PilA
MEMIFRSRKYHYIARAGVFLAVLALIAVGVSCSCAVTEYDLTVAVAHEGSGNATDLTSDSPYATGTKVVVQAVAAAGYQFINWSATAGTFGNINAAQTTFTMPAQDVTVTAYFVEVYSLTMAADPMGGGTATDLTNASPYPAGTEVSIKAVAAAGYQFINWGATTGTFANANVAETTFTMPTQDVTVTAYFVLPTPFTGYWVDPSTAPYVGEVVYLEDQFGAVNATVEGAVLFANPAEQVYNGVTTPIWNTNHHFTAYSLAYEEEPQEWFVEVNNQFGIQQLVVSGPVGLAVPTQKTGHEPPGDLDHLLLYLVVAHEVIEGPSMEVSVGLNDQFGDQPEVWVYDPVIFANPVRKTHGDEVTEIMNPEVHAVVYVTDEGYFDEEVQVVNQFGEQSLHVYGPVLLAVPSEKRNLEPPEHPLAVAAVLGDYNYELIRLLWANNISAEQRDWDVIADIGDYDVVIVNEPDDPGPTDFQAFLDAASADGVGLVFTSSYPTDSSWGISLLEWYSGGPSGQDEDYGSGDVYYKVKQEHPIFAGWDAGDEITIITGGDGDHAWFWDYSGDAIAEVGSSDLGIQGDAVAVGTYGGSRHVLLSSLGPQGWTDVTAWSDDGKTIFINAVFYAAGIP